MLPTSQFFTRGNLGPSGDRVGGGLLRAGVGSWGWNVFPFGRTPEILLTALIIPMICHLLAYIFSPLMTLAGRRYLHPICRQGT